MDVLAKTLRGPFTTTGSGVITQARIFTLDGKLYIAEGQQRGRIVTRVTEYAMPDTDPVPGRGGATSFGPWTWTTCGCGSSWRKHSLESLAAQATPLVVSEVDSAMQTEVSTFIEGQEQAHPGFGGASEGISVPADGSTHIVDIAGQAV